MELITEPTLTELRKAAAPQSYRLIDFETAEVRPGFVPNTFFLIVTGTVPCANMRVELGPVVLSAARSTGKSRWSRACQAQSACRKSGSTRRRFPWTAF